MNYSPDILNCLANLSSDEVFTSPELANRMLDLLPQELFRSSKTSFLDPCSKSGVFLREIAKRLLAGLEEQFPDLQQRIDHIMTQQVFGIACTDLTAEMSRRTLYCTKQANGEYSVATCFNDVQGNLRYMRCQHTWENGKCKHCGANRAQYDRVETIETYAYPFIHKDINKIFKNMQFDVIIGNPPYQLEDGGGRDSAAIPLYHKFVIQAKLLSPRYLSLIIPARWYSGGRGLDEFRDEMIHDKRLRELHDFPETSDCFPGLNIRGGVCYFLWDREYEGMCKVVNHISNRINVSVRQLNEFDCPVLIRYNESISILHKVQMVKEDTFNKYVSVSRPFGMRSNFEDFVGEKDEVNRIKLYRFGTCGFISIDKVTNNTHLIDKYKVIVSKASPGGDEYPHSIISSPILSEPNSVCTETYLVIKSIDTKREGENLISYMKTRFFRFMMSLVKNTQNISRASYMFVPMQDFSHPWTDEMLYKKYDLDKDEIAFIESMIRPME